MSKIEGFTPGPWLAHRTSVVTTKGFQVAQTGFRFGSWPPEIFAAEKANARLIAAAPLLPRLVQALRTINATDDHQQWQTVHDLLTEAEEYGL